MRSCWRLPCWHVLPPFCQWLRLQRMKAMASAWEGLSWSLEQQWKSDVPWGLTAHTFPQSAGLHLCAIFGEASRSYKPKAGSLDPLSSSALLASCCSCHGQIFLLPWTSSNRSYEASPSFSPLPAPSSFGAFSFRVFSLPFLSSQHFTFSLYNLCISEDFCAWLQAFLFLFSSQNSYWDSISVHPSI